MLRNKVRYSTTGPKTGSLLHGELGFDLKSGELYTGSSNLDTLKVTRHDELNSVKKYTSVTDRLPGNFATWVEGEQVIDNLLNINNFRLRNLFTTADVNYTEGGYSNVDGNIVISVPNMQTYASITIKNTKKCMRYTFEVTATFSSGTFYTGNTSSHQKDVVNYSSSSLEQDYDYLETSNNISITSNFKSEFDGDGYAHDFIFLIYNGDVGSTVEITSVSLTSTCLDDSTSLLKSSYKLPSTLSTINTELIKSTSLVKELSNINSMTKSDIINLNTVSPNDKVIKNMLLDRANLLGTNDIPKDDILNIIKNSRYITHTDKTSYPTNKGEFIIIGFMKDLEVHIYNNSISIKTNSVHLSSILLTYKTLILADKESGFGTIVDVVKSYPDKVIVNLRNQSDAITPNIYTVRPFYTSYQCLKDTNSGSYINDTNLFQPTDYVVSQNLYVYKTNKKTMESTHDIIIGTKLFGIEDQNEDTIMTAYFGEKVGDAWEDENYTYRLTEFSGVSFNDFAYHDILNPFGKYKLDDKALEYINSDSSVLDIYTCVIGSTTEVSNPLSDESDEDNLNDTIIRFSNKKVNLDEDSILEYFVNNAENGTLPSSGEELPEIDAIINSVKITSINTYNGINYITTDVTNIDNKLIGYINNPIYPTSYISNNTKDTVFIVANATVSNDGSLMLSIVDSVTSTICNAEKLSTFFSLIDDISIIVSSLSKYTFYNKIPVTEITNRLTNYPSTASKWLSYNKVLLGYEPLLMSGNGNEPLVKLETGSDTPIQLPDSALIKYITNRACSLSTTEHFILSSNCTTGTVTVYDKYTYNKLGELVLPYPSDYMGDTRFTMLEEYGNIYIGDSHKYTNGHRYSGAITIFSAETFEQIGFIDTPSRGSSGNYMYSFSLGAVYNARIFAYSPGRYGSRHGRLYVYDATHFGLLFEYQPDEVKGSDVYFHGPSKYFDGNIGLMGATYMNWLNTSDVGVVFAVDTSQDNNYSIVKKLRPSIGIYKQRFGNSRIVVETLDGPIYFISSARSNRVEVYKKGSTIPKSIILPIPLYSTVRLVDKCCGSIIALAFKDDWNFSHPKYGYIFKIHISTLEYTDITPEWFSSNGEGYSACMNDIDGNLIMADKSYTLGNNDNIYTVRAFKKGEFSESYLRNVSNFKKVKELSLLGTKVSQTNYVIMSNSQSTGVDGSAILSEIGSNVHGGVEPIATLVESESDGIISYDRSSVEDDITLDRVYSLYIDNDGKYIGVIHYTTNGVLDVNDASNSVYFPLDVYS